MNLRQDFEAAWRAGEGHDALLEMVRRYQAQGMPAPEAYRVLHRLWQESGFDAAAEATPLQDNLEYVLEKVWYERPASK